MKLSLSVVHDRVSTLEGVHALVVLENDGPDALELPGPADRSGALALEAHRPDGTRLVRMSGLTRQALMGTGRIDETARLEPLPAGGRFVWELDLARLHHPLPAGPCRLTARYEYEPAGVAEISPSVELEVTAVPLAGATLLEDGAVLDTLALLLRAAPGGEPLAVLRQHNATRPLAAWYSDAVEGPRARVAPQPPIPWDGPTPPFLAAARYATTESFDPAFVKWLIGTDGRKLRAYCFEWARPDPRAASAPLPDGLELLDSASYDEENHLWLAFRAPDGAVTIFAMEPGRLAPLATLPLPPTPRPPLLRWDCDFLHVLAPEDGAVYHRFTHDGTPVRSLRVAGSDLPLHHLSVDPFRRRFRFAFLHPTAGARGGPVVELGAIGPEPEMLAWQRLDDPLRPPGAEDSAPPGPVPRELAFDVDDDGAFHLLAGTAERDLWYLRPGAAPERLATGEERWFPLLRAARGLRAGYFETATGYRFRRLRAGCPLPVDGEGEEAP